MKQATSRRLTDTPDPAPATTPGPPPGPPPGRRPQRRGLAAGLLLLPLLLSHARATEVESVVVSNHSSPSSWLLESDADDGSGFTTRHTIQTHATINFSYSAVPATYRVRYTVVEDGGAIVHTQFGEGFTLNPHTAQTLTKILDVTPGASGRLNPYKVHTMRATLQRQVSSLIWEAVDTADESPGRRYYHFTNTDPADAALNVIGEITAASCQRTHLVGTGTTLASRIPVDVSFTLRRYDAWNVTRARGTVAVAVECQLQDAADGTPVGNPTTSTLNLGVYSHDGAPTPGPHVESHVRTVNLAPGVQLAPVTKTYQVVCRLRHVEVAGSPAVDDNSFTIAAQRFLHFSGALDFAAIPTTFADLAAAPAAPGVFPTHLTTTISPTGGRLAADPTRLFAGAGLGVSLYDDGRAVVTSGNVQLSRPDPDEAVAVGNLRWERTEAVTLDPDGAYCKARLFLPVGLGWSATATGSLLSSRLDLGPTPLDAQLAPAQPEVVVSGEKFFCEETKPVRLRVSAVRWNTATGRIDFDEQDATSIHQQLAAEIDQVDHLLKSPATMVRKRSNDDYYRALSPSVPLAHARAGSRGEALLSAELDLGAGDLAGHFPYDAAVNWTAGRLTVADDLIDPSASMLENPSLVNVTCSRSSLAPGDPCANVAMPVTMQLIPAAGRLAITPDGGLWADGIFASNTPPLKWGAVPGGRFVHALEEHFPRGNVHFPGHFLRGDQYAGPADDAPAVVHLTGVDPRTLAPSERPHTAAYQDGTADYAGLNFRAEEAERMLASSCIAGSDYGPYELKPRSKYYARWSGVSGIHDADESSIPTNARLWGYDFRFVTFGTGYLSNTNVVSRIRGEVGVPFPADTGFPFEQMALSTTGALTAGPLANGPLAGSLDYWNAAYTAHTLAFQTRDGCDPAAGGFLVVGVDLAMSHFNVPLSGSLGLAPDGQILSPADDLEGVTSRFPVPSRLTLHGRMGRDYSFTPVQQAYLNRHSSAAAEPYGFWNLYGRLDVPFFEDLLVHLHVRATAEDTVSPVYLMGGWPDQGWKPLGLSPFEAGTFDPAHDGFPAFDDFGLREYRDVDQLVDDTYHARARRAWLGGLVNFNYALRWNSSQRSFTAASPARNVDVLVAKAQHQVEYLGPDLAHISFGVQYDGLPRINLATAITNEIDEATGFARVLTEAVSEPLFDRLDSGLAEFASLVTDQVDAYVADMLDHQLDPVVDQFFDALRDELQQGGDDAQQRAEDVIRSFFTATGSSVPATTLKAAVRRLGEGGAEADSLLAVVDGKLAGVEQLIDAIINGIPDPELPGSYIPGFLYTDDQGALATLQNVGVKIIEILALIYVAPTLNYELQSLIDAIQPSIDRVRAILTEVKEHVSSLRTRLADGGEFLAEITTILAGANAEFDATVAAAEQEMLAWVARLDAVDYGQIDTLRDEVKALIRRSVMDALRMTDVLADLSNCVRDRVFDLREAFNSAMDSMFAEVNQVVRKALSPALQEVDNQINGALGALGESVGMGRITGFAHINNDTLEALRLDALMQWQVPEELEFEGYLEVKQRRSDGPPGCGSGKHDLYEAAIGALRVPVSWLGSDIRADIGAKFNILDYGGAPVPLGLGGFFEMTEGTIDFESAQITDLGAGTMFSIRADLAGVEEAYLAAHVAVKFSASELAGGVFFGRACSLDPLLMVDPQVAEVLGPPPFTGAYVYGEGTFPLVDFGCVFNVSAGAGVGIFYFLEGPTYGGRMNAHVAGEALCILSVRGDLDLVGLKRGSDYSFSGRGGVKGKVGVCPFCIKFSKSVGVLYKNDEWDVDY